MEDHHTHQEPDCGLCLKRPAYSGNSDNVLLKASLKFGISMIPGTTMIYSVCLEHVRLALLGLVQCTPTNRDIQPEISSKKRKNFEVIRYGGELRLN